MDSETPVSHPGLGSVAAGAGGVAVGGDVHGDIILHPPPEAPAPPIMLPPLPPQGIVGRDHGLAQLNAWMTTAAVPPSSATPIALQGLGGVGKTTLAIAAGHQPALRRQFPDGVLWASLGPRPAVRLLLDHWGRALGVDLLPERDEAACRDRLRALLFDRRMLVLVDDVWEAVHGGYFLVGGPYSQALVTTRETPVAHALATRDRTFRVDVLDPEAALTLLQRLAPEAVTLDPASARRLCERLEFLPLALTLAGRLLADEADVPSRMRRIVGELLERRDARLRLTQAEGRPGLTGDQPVSLQAILGLSVERLTAIDQDRFAMVAVFGGDPLTWDLTAAAHVWECRLPDAEASVARLIQRGLVERRGERYWMHALLADYAAELMDQRGL